MTRTCLWFGCQKTATDHVHVYYPTVDDIADEWFCDDHIDKARTEARDDGYVELIGTGER